MASGKSIAVLGFWTPRRLAFPVFVILAVFLIFTGRSAGLADPDWWWHLETGRLIWERRALPEGDPFSWTMAGEPWVLHEWLFQLGLYGLYAWGGELAVVSATALVLALAWYLVYATADRMIERPLVTLGLAIAFGAGITAVGAPRPHLASLLFFAVLITLVFQAKYGGRRWPLLAIPVMMVLWVNMHGGYALGIAAMAAFALLEWLGLMRKLENHRQIELCLWLTATALLTLAASAVNPYGVAHWAYPLEVATMTATPQIQEWQSIMTLPALGVWYAGGGILFYLIYMSAPRPADATELLFPTALFVAGLVQARHAPFAGMALLLFVAPALWREREVRAPLPGAASVLGWLLALAALATPLALARSGYVEAVAQRVPGDVAAHIREAGLEGRMFNDYGIGGYLIHALGEEHPVFIDGRADLYGDRHIQAYVATSQGRAPLARHFDSWGIGYAVVRRDQPVTQMLLLRRWRLEFRGRTHLILVPPG